MCLVKGNANRNASYSSNIEVMKIKQCLLKFSDGLQHKFLEFDNFNIRRECMDTNTELEILKYLYYRTLSCVAVNLRYITEDDVLLNHKDEIVQLFDSFKMDDVDAAYILDAFKQLSDAADLRNYYGIFGFNWTVTDVIGSVLSAKGNVTLGLAELALADNDKIRQNP